MTGEDLPLGQSASACRLGQSDDGLYLNPAGGESEWLEFEVEAMKPSDADDDDIFFVKKDGSTVWRSEQGQVVHLKSLKLDNMVPEVNIGTDEFEIPLSAGGRRIWKLNTMQDIIRR